MSKNQYIPADQPTMYFIGVTTSKSSIMKVFPAWAEHLKLNAEIKGFDFPPNDAPEQYREAVAFIKQDPNSLGSLVTTHKLNLFKACRDLFEGVGPYAKILDEISSISNADRNCGDTPRTLLRAVFRWKRLSMIVIGRVPARNSCCWAQADHRWL